VNQNREINMKTIQLITVVALISSLSGCATRSRLGDLIPAHHNSNQRAGEEVWVHVAAGSDSAAMAARNPVPIPAVAGPLAAAAVGMAIDYIKGQLQNEAKLYDAQFGEKVWLDTQQILQKKRVNLLLMRWVDGGPDAPDEQQYKSALDEIRAIVTNPWRVPPPT
jgi:hypothetical protein